MSKSYCRNVVIWDCSLRGGIIPHPPQLNPLCPSALLSYLSDQPFIYFGSIYEVPTLCHTLYWDLEALQCHHRMTGGVNKVMAIAHILIINKFNMAEILNPWLTKSRIDTDRISRCSLSFDILNNLQQRSECLLIPLVLNSAFVPTWVGRVTSGT